MTCLDMGALAELLGGQLDRERAAEVRAHLEGCERCRERLRQVEGTTAVTVQTLRGRRRPRSARNQPVPPRAAEPVRSPSRPARGGEPRNRDTVGRYQVRRNIGVGGMGVVLAAYDPQLDREVAIKLIRADKQGGPAGASARQARLLREAQAMAHLSHPNVVQVYDSGKHGDEVFVAMELIEGQTLHRWLREEARPWPEIASVFEQAGRGLAAAHQKGLVHRDFKPDNVLVGDDGRVRVTDFGLARPSGDVDESEPAPPGRLLATRLTQAGAVAGTPAFMAPEIFDGVIGDARSDQFSFCVSLYKALYGAHPFGNQWHTLSDERELELEPAPAGSRVPAWLRAVVVRGLALDPDERWPSMNALLDALRGDPRAARRWVAGSVAAALGAGAIVVLLVGRSGAATPDVDPCPPAAARLEGVWDQAARERGRGAFAATGVGYAGDSWSDAVAVLDDYAARWAEAGDRACRDRHVRGVLEKEAWHLRAACLEQRRSELGAVAAVLGEADRGVVERAGATVRSLGDLGACEDRRALTLLPLPEGEVARREVARLRARIAEVKALHDAGKYAKAAEAAERVAGDAESLDYPPIRAEALVQLGRLQRKAGKVKEAEATLSEGLFVAEAAGHDAAAVTALNDLVFIVGYRGRRFDEALALARRAEALLQRMGEPVELHATYLNNLASVHYRRGNLDRALELHQQSHDIRVEIGDEVGLTYALANIGSTLAEQGRFAEARGYQERNLELVKRIFGPDHPKAAADHYNLGYTLRDLGELERAIEHQERAAAITESTMGRENLLWILRSSQLAYTLGKAGKLDRARLLSATVVEVAREVTGDRGVDFAFATLDAAEIQAWSGDVAKAEAGIDRSLAMLEAELGPESVDLTYALLARAGLLRATSRCAAALEPLERTLAIAEKHLAADHPRVAEALALMGGCMVDLGRPGEARRYLERAHRLYQARPVDPMRRAEVLFELARAGGDRAHAELAADLYRTAGERARAPLARVVAWLAKRPGH